MNEYYNCVCGKASACETPQGSIQEQTSHPQLQGSNVTSLSQSEHSTPWLLVLVQIKGKDLTGTEEE